MSKGKVLLRPNEIDGNLKDGAKFPVFDTSPDGKSNPVRKLISYKPKTAKAQSSYFSLTSLFIATVVVAGAATAANQYQKVNGNN